MKHGKIPARLLWIVDRPAIENGVLTSALRVGVPWIHLRDDGVESDVWRARLASFQGTRVVVNGGPSWALEEGWGAHLKASQSTLSTKQRAAWSLLGRSVHDIGETHAASCDEPDYLVAGPVFPTSSKAGHPGIGLDALRSIVRSAHGRPVLAIGGIVPGNVRSVIDAGAFGVSVRSGITEAPDPAAAVEALLLPVDPR